MKTAQGEAEEGRCFSAATHGEKVRKWVQLFLLAAIGLLVGWTSWSLDQRIKQVGDAHYVIMSTYERDRKADAALRAAELTQLTGKLDDVAQELRHLRLVVEGRPAKP